MCVTMDSANVLCCIALMALCKAPIGKGILWIVDVVDVVNLLYTGRGQLCSIVCNPRVLAGKGLTVTPLSGIQFPPGGKHH